MNAHTHTHARTHTNNPNYSRSNGIDSILYMCACDYAFACIWINVQHHMLTPPSRHLIFWKRHFGGVKHFCCSKSECAGYCHRLLSSVVFFEWPAVFEILIHKHTCTILLISNPFLCSQPRITCRKICTNKIDQPFPIFWAYYSFIHFIALWTMFIGGIWQTVATMNRC